MKLKLKMSCHFIDESYHAHWIKNTMMIFFVKWNYYCENVLVELLNVDKKLGVHVVGCNKIKCAAATNPHCDLTSKEDSENNSPLIKTHAKVLFCLNMQ